MEAMAEEIGVMKRTRSGTEHSRTGATRRLGLAGIALATVTLAVLLPGTSTRAALPMQPSSWRAPERLSQTGLYADVASRRVAPDNLPFEPQYPLWSDGAAKRRWIHLPPGATIDASDPDEWVFPAGTKLWKEFSFGRRVETRYMEYAGEGRWIYATYVWNQDETDAVLAPERGVVGAHEIRPGVRHDIPGYYDCLACHEGRPSRVLGFSALQLSSDRDPLAPHAQAPAPDAINLDVLIERGLLRGYPNAPAGRAPRINAKSPRARAALGYLHANCGSCHNDRGPLANLGMFLDAKLSGKDGATRSRELVTAVDRPSRFRPPAQSEADTLGASAFLRIAAGHPERSVLIARMSSRTAVLQMPPLGTHIVDEEAVALLDSWIRNDLHPRGAAIALNHKHVPEERK
jgi:mono/diheme cytochrome c family protein